LSLLDLETARHRRTNARERVQRSSDDIRRSAHDIVEGRVARIDLRYPQMIGVWMRSGFDDSTNDYLSEILSKRDDIVDGRTSHCEQITQLRWRHIDIYEIAQPLN